MDISVDVDPTPAATKKVAVKPVIDGSSEEVKKEEEEEGGHGDYSDNSDNSESSDNSDSNGYHH